METIVIQMMKNIIYASILAIKNLNLNHNFTVSLMIQKFTQYIFFTKMIASSQNFTIILDQ